MGFYSRGISIYRELLYPEKGRCTEKLRSSILPVMTHEERYDVEGKRVIEGPFPDEQEKPFDAKDLEPFGNEENAEVQYRTMKWWHCGMREFTSNCCGHQLYLKSIYTFPNQHSSHDC